MKRNIRTIYGNMLQVANQLGVPHRILERSTLNEKLKMQAGVKPPAGNNPKMQYFAIGYGGHLGYMGKNNTYLSTAIDHQPDHAALYKQMPFILREPANDLSQDQRLKYRLRTIWVDETDGKKYIAYWLKVISMSNVVIQSKKSVRDPVTNQLVPEDWTPDSSALNPQPPSLDTNNLDQVVTSATFYSANAELDLSLTALDCAELLNVARIMMKDEAYALVSEYALISGVDQVVTGDNATGGSMQYTEILAAQVNNFLTNRGAAADDSDTGVECMVNYGATEALVADNATNAVFLNK